VPILGLQNEAYTAAFLAYKGINGCNITF